MTAAGILYLLALTAMLAGIVFDGLMIRDQRRARDDRRD